jgi:LacI family transcriptional regulator, gluconate utilization system Gnt-I transcriptional repressor
VTEPSALKVQKWVTMQDVARMAGVSTITVSRALRMPDKVKAPTRERIDAAIRALGYVPDQIAGSLSSRESRLVAALVSTLSGSIFASTVDGLAQSLREQGHQLLLGTTEYSSTSEEELIATALSRRPDGLVLTSSEHTPATSQMLANAALPVVEVWDLPEQPIDMAVGFSNVEAGRAITRFLYDTGRRRIGFIGAMQEGDRRGRLRLQGYAAVMQELSLGPPRSVVDAGTVPMVERGARNFAELMQRWPDTDAIFCASDSVALGALSESRRQGIAVPVQLAIAGFGDFEFAGEHGLALTTVRIPGHRIGAEAGRMIIRRKQGDADVPKTVDVGFEVVRRASA